MHVLCVEERGFSCAAQSAHAEAAEGLSSTRIGQKSYFEKMLFQAKKKLPDY